MAGELLPHQIESLEFQISQALEAVRHAATTRQDQDTLWAWVMYGALDVNLRLNIFPHIRNGTEIPRTAQVDRNLLLYAITRELPTYLRTAMTERKRGATTPRVEPVLTDEILQKLVADRQRPYQAIWARASELVRAGHVEAIFAAVDYVKAEYAAIMK